MKWLAPVSCVLAVAYATPQATGTGDKGQACPGSIQGNGGGVDDNYCCVGGSAQVSNCPGWPICSGAPTTTAKPVSCATKITLTDSDYFELVSSASSKYLDGNGSIKASATATSEGNEAQATQSGKTSPLYQD